MESLYPQLREEMERYLKELDIDLGPLKIQNHGSGVLVHIGARVIPVSANQLKVGQTNNFKILATGIVNKAKNMHSLYGIVDTFDGYDVQRELNDVFCKLVAIFGGIPEDLAAKTDDLSVDIIKAREVNEKMVRTIVDLFQKEKQKALRKDKIIEKKGKLVREAQTDPDFIAIE